MSNYIAEQIKELEAQKTKIERQILTLTAYQEKFEGAAPAPKKTRRKRTPKANGSEALIEGAAKRIMGPDLREEL